MLKAPIALCLALVAFFSLACARNQTDASDDDPQARLEVENRSSVDMDIYVRNDRGGATRLGLAPAGETTTFGLAPGYLVGAGLVRFEARPVRGQGSSVLSDPYRPGRGELVTWSIPPQ